MGMVEGCDDMVYYTMDQWIPCLVYLWCVADLMLVVVLFALGHAAFEGRLIGLCFYRIYKIFWFLTTPVAFLLWMFDIISTLAWPTLVISLQIELSLKFIFSLAGLLGTVVVMFDTLQIAVLILTVICPKC